MKKTKIAALVGVRKGSERCPNKNTKPFGDTTLLDLKLQTLTNISEIDKIIVTTDCPRAKTLAKTYSSVMVIDREPYYASSECTNGEYFRHIAEKTEDIYDTLIFAPVTAPFVTSNTIRKCISIFNSDSKHDAVCTVNPVNMFLWMNNKPLNYDPNEDVHPKTQELPKVFNINFGLAIISRQNQIDYASCIGKKPYFHVVDELESTDIDTTFDFDVAEMMYNHNNQKDRSSNIVDHSLFLKFRELHTGESVVLYGPGESLKKCHFKFPDACKAAVNSTILFEDMSQDLDYYIWSGDLHTPSTNRPWFNETLEATCLLPEKTRKFVCSHISGGRTNPQYGIISQISPVIVKKLGMTPYNVTAGFNKDIHKEGLNWFSVVFQAMQILLYMGFSRITLVGFDCCGQYAFSDNRSCEWDKMSQKLITKWKEFKQFASKEYSHCVIDVVNPIGLKNIFPEYIP